MGESYRVDMTGITKSFGGVHALHDVTLKVKPGEIHALVGENGAGKSTLMKILSGVYQKDSGEIRIDNRVVSIPNPHTGRKLGVAVIYQEFALVPDLSVAENIYLDRLSTFKGLINWRRLHADAAALIARMGFQINPHTRVMHLSVACQQIVEIVKALTENVRILILDEPTAVLVPHEVNCLFDILKKLKTQGVSIIYISHRLEEIFQIADRVTVLKDGCVTGILDPACVTPDDIIHRMIGRRLTTLFPPRAYVLGKVLFQVKGLTRGQQVRDVSFSVRAGEVLGMAGLVGSGRTETVRTIFAADKKDQGTLTLAGKTLNPRSPYDAVRSGIALIPEDRTMQGVIPSLPVRHNVTMTRLARVTNRLGIIKQQQERKMTQALIEKLVIKTRNLDTPVGDLSGGNQQKVVLAKWFDTDCRVIILDEPTRGVDVGAKIEIYHLINTLAEQGLALIVVSSDMLELIGLCDRIVVMRGGRLQKVLAKDELSEETIMRAAIGQDMKENE